MPAPGPCSTGADPADQPRCDQLARDGSDQVDAAELRHLLTVLPQSAGLQVCVSDPDLDVDGRYAAVVADVLVDALSQ